jgi:adenine-specific DNA-methyltransferase
MSRKQRLELNWIGKDDRPHLEPRILFEDPARSHHATLRVTDHDLFDNRLIFGDNLLALKALEAEFAGAVKCVFIDPPYNTGSAFEHYDDGLEHSTWLSLMRDRLEILLRLLTEDGAIWITIDDNEAHYLKVLCDEIFGRSNFVASMVWEKDSGRKNDTDISSSHDYVLLFARNHEIWRKDAQYACALGGAVKTIPESGQRPERPLAARRRRHGEKRRAESALSDNAAIWAQSHTTKW